MVVAVLINDFTLSKEYNFQNLYMYLEFKDKIKLLIILIINSSKFDFKMRLKITELN